MLKVEPSGGCLHWKQIVLQNQNKRPLKFLIQLKTLNLKRMWPMIVILQILFRKHFTKAVIFVCHSIEVISLIGIVSFWSIMTTLQKSFLWNCKHHKHNTLNMISNQFQRKILYNIVIISKKLTTYLLIRKGTNSFWRCKVVFQVNAHVRGNTDKAY